MSKKVQNPCMVMLIDLNLYQKLFFIDKILRYIFKASEFLNTCNTVTENIVCLT